MRGNWTPLRSKKHSGLLFKKEVLPCDDFVKWVSGDPKQALPIRVRRQFLDKLVLDFEQFKRVGVRVPVFATHNEHPDNDRGTVRKLTVERNSAGRDALFAVIEFNDEKAAEQGTKVDVSAMCPPRFIDGKGNGYEYPLRHVALTSTPVIPGLSAFEPVVLAFEPVAPKVEITKMDDKLNAILAKLGITAPEGADPMAKMDLILAALEEEGAAPAAAPLGLSFSPVMVRQFGSGRTAVIDSLVAEGVLTPAVADDWRKTYASQEALLADLQLDSETGETEFDRMVGMARKLAPKRDGRLPKGAVVLSHGKSDAGSSDDEKEPITVRNMRKRAAAAKR